MNTQFDLFSSSGFDEENVRILYLDTETTGPDPETAEVCEIALLLSSYHGFSRELENDIELDELVKPSEPIPPEASAVNHITNAMISGKPALEDFSTEIAELVGMADLLCAHNLGYDLTILQRQLPEIFSGIGPEQRLDSLRLSRHIWPAIPSHALQALRYRYQLDSHMTGDAHRAMFDTKLVRELVELITDSALVKLTGWSELVDFTQSALEIKIFAFGKYRGKLVEDIAAQDQDYIRWLLRQKWIPVDYPDLYDTLLRKTNEKEPTQ